MDVVAVMARQLRQEPFVQWLEAVPIPMAVINRHRQILFCNKPFCSVALKMECVEILGLRPGEALNCVHSKTMRAGCGCSDFCVVCGAAKAIIKSLDGEQDCRECRMMRLENGTAVPLDLQVFTRPVEFQGALLSAVFVLDISHEKRLAYLNRTFHHNLVNGVGGINALADILDSGHETSPILDLLVDATRRTLRVVLYNRDIEAAEQGKLAVTMETFNAAEFLREQAHEECRLRNIQENCTEIEPTRMTLRTDKRILGHILSNMLENALEAREEEDKPGPITLSCSRLDNGRTAVAVRNTGTILSEIQKQMFKRYVSTKSRDRGLGTYVMKLFAERYLGGEVLFTSQNNETTFVVVLPAAGRGEANAKEYPQGI